MPKAPPFFAFESRPSGGLAVESSPVVYSGAAPAPSGLRDDAPPLADPALDHTFDEPGVQGRLFPHPFNLPDRGNPISPCVRLPENISALKKRLRSIHPSFADFEV